MANCSLICARASATSAGPADSRELPLLYSGEGEIVLETEGTDWYVCQKEKTDRTR